MNVLLVYFSRAGENYYRGERRDLDVGNTEVLAGMIADRIGCDTYRIEAADAYSDAYDPTVERNVREQQDDARPAIAGPLPDLSNYDVVLLGSPVWNMRAPMIMSTFVDSSDLAGKTILPFVTEAVSGMSGIDGDYRRAVPDADVRDGLAVQGEDVTDAAADLDAWLKANGLYPA
ncbi:flavodoxin [soil metagenome]